MDETKGLPPGVLAMLVNDPEAAQVALRTSGIYVAVWGSVDDDNDDILHLTIHTNASDEGLGGGLDTVQALTGELLGAAAAVLMRGTHVADMPRTTR